MESMTLEIFCRNVQRKRLERGLSQTKLAKLADISRTTLVKIENHDVHEGLSIGVMERISNALGLPLAILISKSIDEAAEFDWHLYESTTVQKYYSGRDRLFEFLLYLPLLDRATLLDSLQRIGADFIGDERYVEEQLKFLKNSIPEGPAKNFAHEIADRILEIKKTKDNDAKVDLLRKYDGGIESDHHNPDYEAYMNLIEYEYERALLYKNMERFLSQQGTDKFSRIKDKIKRDKEKLDS